MELSKKVQQIVKDMTLEDKIGQVTQISFSHESLNEISDVVKRIRPGSIILCGSSLGGNEKQHSVQVDTINAIQKVAVEKTALGIPILFGRDVIHGHRVAFPVPLTMTASYDFDLIKKCYDAIREEAISDGIKWTFAPMLDMSRDARWGRIVEGTGEDPYLGECFAKSAVEGFQTDRYCSEYSMIACAKHFIGYGASEGGRDYNHTEISDYSMQNYYLPAFRSAVKSGVGTVMAAFNDINGIPASGNKKMLTDVLRDQLGFNGFVVSDWGGIMQMSEFQGFADDEKIAAAKAIKSGIDMDMMSECYIKNLSFLIKSGEISENILNRAVSRIIETKLRFGLFEFPYIKPKKYIIKKHLDLAKRMAEESVVLLKNNNNLLPLDKEKTFGVCGDYLDKGEELVGTWSLDYDPAFSKSIIDALKEKVNIIDIRNDDFYRCLTINKCDTVIIVIGESRAVTGEANSLSNIGIAKEQIALVEKIKNIGMKIIGVFCFARPIVFGKEQDLFDAVIYAGHGGSMAAEAIASVLTGEVQPQGHLPFTLPYSQGQMPLYYNALPGARDMNGYYGKQNPAHMNYCDCRGEPNFPFGYGLTYTKFEYSRINCKKSEMYVKELEEGKRFEFEISVKNIGNYVGTAVVQLYIHDVSASRIRPLKVLRGIHRITIEPGKFETFTMSIGKNDLGFYLENGEFVLEKGKFIIYIGDNSLAENTSEIILK